MSATQVVSVERMQWLMNRLRCMSPGEVGYRLQQAAMQKAVAALPSLRRVPCAEFSGPMLDVVLPSVPEVGRDRILAEADELLAGSVTLFADQVFEVSREPDWNRCVKTGVSGPVVLAYKINIKDKRVVGDIKYVWELNRHLHWVRLAQAWALTRDERYLDALRMQWRSWLHQCPALCGPNWTSSLEMAIRLINWALVWQLIGGWSATLFESDDGAALRAEILAAVYAQVEFIRRHPSRHSSANNHLLGELAGVYVAARNWPYWRRAADWARWSKAELETESVRQFTREGANREQAFSYHVFACEFLLVAGVFSHAADDPFLTDYWATLAKARGFLGAVMDVAGHMPQVGDADDGVVFKLDPACRNPALQMRDLIDVATARQKSGTGAAAWLLRDDLVARFSKDRSDSGWMYSEAGYFVFGTDFGSEHEIKGLVDCGPLGYLGIAAHGHADSLMTLLSVCGEPCLIDSGTYSYWDGKVWRDYFRGTSAHNTMRIDGLDQSVSGGPFMWTHKASASVLQQPSGPASFRFSGEHDGYARLADPVTHRRDVAFSAESRSLHVRDTVESAGEHDLEVFWHFAPDLNVELVEGALLVTGQRFRLRGTFEAAVLELTVHTGETDPPLGWCSSAYGRKRPCTVLRIAARAQGWTVESRFEIELFRDSVKGVD